MRPDQIPIEAAKAHARAMGRCECGDCIKWDVNALAVTFAAWPRAAELEQGTASPAGLFLPFAAEAGK